MVFLKIIWKGFILAYNQKRAKEITLAFFAFYLQLLIDILYD